MESEENIMISIKDRFTGEEIYRFDGDSLREADLREVNLRNADLHEMNLYGANLSEANLYGVDLIGANLSEANLEGADLRYVDLCRADLYKANLFRANLQYADLQYANLQKANLYGVDLKESDLERANLTDAKGIVCLGTDPRGYRFVGVQHDDGWWILAGCRWFTLDKAKVHWANNSDALARINTLSEKTI
jgi:uncharacterized protein YjbI with pentapeptide repeats